MSVKNQFSLKLWAPKAGRLLLKIEGGIGAKEVELQVTELNKWVTYTADFTSEIGKNHTKIVVFINAFVNGEPGDVYYVDDIKLTGAPTVVLEDFQGGQNLAWQPLDQNDVIHGTFTGPTANSSPNDVNSSSEVGCYSKGTSGFSTLQAISPVENLDLSIYGQFNIDVLSPAGGGTVTMQLSSPTEGNKEATATITTPGEWETLSFDFSAFDAITNFGELRLIFNVGNAAAGESWCIDNLTQSKITIDACAEVLPIPNIIEDFECQQNYALVFYGADDLKTINNPDLTPENGSLKVGEYVDPAGAFAGIGYEFAQAPDLSVYNHLTFQIWSPTANVPFLIKLQGPTSVEIFDTITTANVWQKFDIDFSGAVGTEAKQIVIFFNVGNEAGGGTYYIDNVRWARAGYNGCIVDNETATTTLGWRYFANGHLEAEAYEFRVVDNPAPGGINVSENVGEFVKADDALPFAGIYTSPDLESAIDFRGVKTVRAKVYMDHIGNFAVKLEGSATGAPAIEIPIANTKINEWEEFTFDFSVAADNAEYKRLTLFFDFLMEPTGQDVTSYFDDIVIGAGQCGTSSVFNPGPVAAMSVSPNPVSNRLIVSNFQDMARIDVFNAYGQRVATVQTYNENQTDLDVSHFPVGLYALVGFSKQGALLGNAKFVKQ
ncbi:MAG: T9SS type A sorting domain-containing protein [Saprospiraceae bacterium]|nr:T9SS type A sorting domain-containing protein [Saprospiraceae bacterium]